MIPSAARCYGYWSLTATLQRRLQRRLRMLLNGPDNPSKFPFPLGDLHPRLIHGFFGPSESSSKTASRWVQKFCTAHRRVSHCFKMGPTFSHKLPIPLRDRVSHLMHGTYGPPESSFQKASRWVQPFLYGSQMLCCTKHYYLWVIRNQSKLTTDSYW